MAKNGSNAQAVAEVGMHRSVDLMPVTPAIRGL